MKKNLVLMLLLSLSGFAQEKLAKKIVSNIEMKSTSTLWLINKNDNVEQAILLQKQGFEEMNTGWLIIFDSPTEKKLHIIVREIKQIKDYLVEESKIDSAGILIKKRKITSIDITKYPISKDKNGYIMIDSDEFYFCEPAKYELSKSEYEKIKNIVLTKKNSETKGIETKK